MTQPWEFEEPVIQGDRFTAEEAQNRRLIVVPTEYVPQIRTARGDIVDAIRINVVDLDNQGQTYWGALWFGSKLIQTFKPKPGKLFLGYVSKQATGGGFQAWIFTSLTADAASTAMAQQFLAGNPNFMETCAGDVAMAERNAQRPPQAPQQGWGAQQPGQWQQPNPPQERPQWPVQQQPQQQWPVQQQQRQAPPPPPVNPPLPPVQAPVVPGPAPLPPPTATDQWPAQTPGQAQPSGNGQGEVPAVVRAPAALPDPPPVPTGSSVMERLRAQRDQADTPVMQDTGNLPF